MPLRVGPYAAEELLVTGRTVDATEAKALRLVDDVCAEDVDPAEAALAWAKTHLLELSPSSLRFAVAAVRSAWADGALQQLDALERLYLSELMATHDAKEGIAAFLEKRKPTWQGLREA